MKDNLLAGEAVELRLPADPLLLEEINLPEELAHALAGSTVSVRAFPEEEPGTRRVERDDFPLLVDREGNCWNDYRPLRVYYTGSDGRIWHLPRNWLPQWPANAEPAFDAGPGVSREVAFVEEFQLPSVWDMWSVNIPEERVEGVRAVTEVEVRISPPDRVRIFWRDRIGAIWRLPHNWRKRRIQLPSEEVLTSQGIPTDVAAEFANRIVSVNYHPGSLCCLLEHYRFRDNADQKWPVRITDCLLLGYGSATEARA